MKNQALHVGINRPPGAIFGHMVWVDLLLLNLFSDNTPYVNVEEHLEMV